MKYSEIKDENIRRANIQYINECWTGHRDSRLSSLNRITNYLFVLNSGALLASLAYVATKSCTTGMINSIWMFSIGTFFISFHAAIDYYACQQFFNSYRIDVNLFYKNEIDWEVLVGKNNQRGKSDWYMHVLCWFSGVLFLIGLFNGIYNIS